MGKEEKKYDRIRHTVSSSLSMILLPYFSLHLCKLVSSDMLHTDQCSLPISSEGANKISFFFISFCDIVT